MTLSDTILIAKKILVGIVLVVIPFMILWAGITLTQKVLTPGQSYNAPVNTSYKK